MDERELLIAKIAVAEQELKSAGPIHRRDLIRQIRRLQRKLRACERSLRTSMATNCSASATGANYISK